MKGPGNFDDRIDRFYTGKEPKIEFLLDVNERLGIHVESLHFIESLYYLFGGTATPMIVEVLSQIRPMRCKCQFPSFVVEAHRIGKRAITVEDISLKITFR